MTPPDQPRSPVWTDLPERPPTGPRPAPPAGTGPVGAPPPPPAWAGTVAPPPPPPAPPAPPGGWASGGTPAPGAPLDDELPRDDPRWTRPALAVLLALTAVLYLWGLGASGWANSFYSAAAQAGSASWKAFLFGSSDAANLITVDKPPASLWVMGLSVRLFGLSSWSILVPQALMGVASVGTLFAAVRRWHGAVAGLLAGLVLALTPVATLMFRFNNPDALLVLLLTLSAYFLVRALEPEASRWWVLAVGAAIGFAFLAKALQAFLVVPGFALVWLIAAPSSWKRRLTDLALAGGAMVVAAGWWVALVQLWPASSRPYIGGSQDNSFLSVVFGYNGFGRLTGNETGSVVPGAAGRGPAGGMWGPTGLTRLFNDSFGGQIAWLLPAALLLLVALLALTLRARRTDHVRASALIWGSWLIVTGLVISLSQGIIHQYYTVALAPAVGALVGIGSVELWRRRRNPLVGAVMAAVVAVTAIWAFVLLDRTPSWEPWVRTVVLIGGLAIAAALLMAYQLPRRAALALGGVGLATMLLGPAAYSLETASTPHAGAIPTAGPSSFGGPGGFGGPGRARGGFPGGGRFPGGGQFPGGGRFGGAGGFPGGAPGGGGGGGLLNAATPGPNLVALLEKDAGHYTWVAAAVGSNEAAGYQLATGDPVMALGGFNGSDPYPTLQQFQTWVQEGKVHYFIGGGGFGGPGGRGGQLGGSRASASIASWVQENFTAQTVDGVTVYDLTPAG